MAAKLRLFPCIRAIIIRKIDWCGWMCHLLRHLCFYPQHKRDGSFCVIFLQELKWACKAGITTIILPATHRMAGNWKYPIANHALQREAPPVSGSSYIFLTKPLDKSEKTPIFATENENIKDKWTADLHHAPMKRCWKPYATFRLNSVNGLRNRTSG